jgi:hypothetical protein
VNRSNERKTDKRHEYTNTGKLRRIQIMIAAVRYVTSGAGHNEISARLVFVGQSVLRACLSCQKVEVFLEELTVVQSAGHSTSYYRSQSRRHVFLKYVLHSSVCFTDNCVYLLLI